MTAIGPWSSTCSRCFTFPDLFADRAQTMSSKFKIADVRVYLVGTKGSGGDYFQQSQGHWVIDSLIANPMSGYPAYRDKRSSWGIGVLGSIVVEIETTD